MLYSYEKKYDKSLSTYLSLRNKDVFTLIEKHKLHAMIHDMIVELMQLDSEKAIALLLDNKIPPEVVVTKLRDHERLLYNVSYKNYLAHICIDIFYSVVG